MGRGLESGDARDSCGSVLSIKLILAAEHADQVVLLDGDAVSKEAPCGEREGDGRDEVGEQDLGADGPHEPA